MTGQTLSHYRILGPLGAGGMGVVYLAEDQRLGRQVALKFLPADSVQNQQALDRFRLEARTASSLSHPGICAIYDIGVHEGAPYIVMELLKGETLRERVVRGPMKIADVLDIGIQLADALEAAHAQGVVHRDIKPANIWVGEKLRVKILDFGLAKLASHHSALSTGAVNTRAATNVTQAASPGIEHQLTEPGTAIGTVSYMSPEQARGEDVDARTDVFSLGVVLYEMVTGRQAFAGSTSAVVFDSILNRAPVSPVLLNPDTPPKLHEAINTALEKDRDLRYQTAASLEVELKRIRRDLQSGAMASASRIAAAVPSAPTSAPTTVHTAAAEAVTLAGSAAAATPGEAVTAATRKPTGIVAAAMVALVMGGGAWYVMSRNTISPTSTAAESVRRAQVRLDARDFRAAAAEAGAALSQDPANADAARIKAIADERVQRLEELLAEARRAHGASDAVSASRALAAAQVMSPGDARVAALAAEVARNSSATTGTIAPAAGSPPQSPPSSARSSATPTTSPVSRPMVAAPPSTAPPATTAPPPVTQSQTPTPAPPVAAPASVEPPAAPLPQPAPPVERRVEPPVAPPPAPTPAAPSAPSAPSDDVLVRRAIDTYERALETEDLALFRTVRPGLTASEESRLRTSFAQVERHQIDLRIESLSIAGDTAEARITRQDTVDTGGRPQTSRSTQTIRLQKRAGHWIIVELGR